MEIGKLKYSGGKTLYNKRVLHFFLRLFVLATIWFVVYALILRPNRLIDRPLTNFITVTVVKSVNFLSPSTPPISWAEDQVRPCAYLIQNERNVFGIYDVCNGIDLMFIYVGIIVLLPYPAKRKFLFSVAGLAALIIANIIRICMLYLIYVHYRTAFDFSHHYLFTLLMYVLIFYGWLLFTKKGRIYEEGH